MREIFNATIKFHLGDIRDKDCTDDITGYRLYFSCSCL